MEIEIRDYITYILSKLKIENIDKILYFFGHPYLEQTSNKPLDYELYNIILNDNEYFYNIINIIKKFSIYITCNGCNCNIDSNKRYECYYSINMTDEIKSMYPNDENEEDTFDLCEKCILDNKFDNIRSKLTKNQLGINGTKHVPIHEFNCSRLYKIYFKNDKVIVFYESCCSAYNKNIKLYNDIKYNEFIEMCTYNKNDLLDINQIFKICENILD